MNAVAKFYKENIKIETVRINSIDLMSIKKRIKQGYYPVETLLTFNYYTKNYCPLVDFLFLKLNVKSYFATKKDINQISEIAKKSFKYDRFHKDPNIKDSTANEFYRIWGMNLLKRNKKVIVVKNRHGKILGFLGFYEEGKDAKIDLIAVHPDYVGKGIGEKLVDSFLTYCIDKYEFALTGTQSTNIPAVKLYEKCGFRLIKSEVTMHRGIEK